MILGGITTLAPSPVLKYKLLDFKKVLKTSTKIKFTFCENQHKLVSADNHNSNHWSKLGFPTIENPRIAKHMILGGIPSLAPPAPPSPVLK